jgi:outer membrane immunogenic protein
MKRLALSVSILVASVVGASAADLAPRPYTKAPPPIVAPIYDWSGFYIGLDGGGGWARKCWDISQNGAALIVPAFREGCSSASGGMAGAQAGYRWQSAAWVFGVEAKGDWANLRGSNTSLFYGPVVTNQSRVNGIGIFTGEVGYAVNNVLFYGKGGAAVAADKYYGMFTASGTAFDTASETRVGGYVGVGVEFGITPNVSIAGEYGHAFMGSRTLNFTSTGAFIPAGAFSRTDSVTQDMDLFTVRVNYRFGGPVVARY